MKKQYALVLLLVLGFGIVTTMAFELNTPDAAIPDAYAVSADETEASVSSVKIRPSKGGDRMIITLGLADMTASSSYAIGVELSDTAGTDGYYDLSSPTSVSPSANGDEVYAEGYYETTYTATGTTGTLQIKLDKASIWVEVDGIMITIADA